MVVYGSSTALVLLAATPLLLLAGGQSHHSSRRTLVGAQLTAAAGSPSELPAAALAATALPVASTPSAGAKPVLAAGAPSAPAGSRAPQPGAPAAPAVAGPAPATATATNVAAGLAVPVAAANQVLGNLTATLASWYAERPSACYDAGGGTTTMATSTTLWIAAPGLPCGTIVEVTGPNGVADLQVQDHGPYVGPTRGLDLSPAAFQLLVGSLDRGVAPVTYRVVIGHK